VIEEIVLLAVELMQSPEQLREMRLQSVNEALPFVGTDLRLEARFQARQQSVQRGGRLFLVPGIVIYQNVRTLVLVVLNKG
jgi:hypothetical protein